MLPTKLATRNSQLAPRAITLVEMLISMAVTLIMMAAVVNLFANIGAGVKKRNASMELGSQLRQARSRLFKDLAGATSPARPKLPSDDHDDGYLEIIEGQWSDKNPSALIDGVAGNGELDYATSIVPSSNVKPAGNVTDGGGLGDYDDILALTVRSESEPFVGRMVTWNGAQWIVTTIESDLAEIIWFAVENPADGSNGEPGMRTVYRRVLLIAPWVDELPPEQSTTTPLKAISLDRVYYQLSDVSFRRVVNGTGNVMRVPNALSDLAKRENRFGHFRVDFPHALELKPIRIDPTAGVRKNFPAYYAPVGGKTKRPVMHPFGLPFEWDESEVFNEQTEIPKTPPGEHATTGNPTEGDDRQGEDVMLNDVLAFDLRVYDPGAPLYAVGGNVLEPSDSGWAAAYLDQEQPTAGTPLFDAMIGQGAYVDMGYVEAVALASIPPNPTPPAPQPTRPLFDGVSSLQSLLNFSAVAFPIKSIAYDTWPYHYESDGLDQDGDGVDSNGDGNLDTFVDEGTDGLDNDNNNGVDDPGERETAPPYDVPLRGMQIKLRVYDRDTRQIREATVTRNFVPQ